MSENDAERAAEEIIEVPEETIGAAVDTVADVEQTIENTPTEDMDAAWKRMITSELALIREKLDKLASVPESSISETAEQTTEEADETPTEVQEIVVDAPKETKATKTRRGLLSRRRR